MGKKLGEMGNKHMKRRSTLSAISKMQNLKPVMKMF